MSVCCYDMFTYDKSGSPVVNTVQQLSLTIDVHHDSLGLAKVHLYVAAVIKYIKWIPALYSLVMFVYGSKGKINDSLYSVIRDWRMFLPLCTVNSLLPRGRGASAAVLGLVDPDGYSGLLHNCTTQHRVGWIFLKSDLTIFIGKYSIMYLKSVLSRCSTAISNEISANLSHCWKL